MTGRYSQPTEGKTELGVDIAGLREGGGRRADIESFIPGSGAVHPDLKLLDMGGDPPHQENPGGFPPPYQKAYYREATLETSQWKLEVNPAGGDDVRGGVGGTGNVHFQKVEQGGSVNSD